MLDISLPADRTYDGEDITEVLNGFSTDHGPIFSLRRDRVMTIRHGDWKLFLQKPRYYRGVDKNYLVSWNKRNPDGETIIAPKEQYRPTAYPGVKPIDSNEFPLLFNLKEDPAETTNLAKKHPEIVLQMQQSYEAFMSTIPVKTKIE